MWIKTRKGWRRLGGKLKPLPLYPLDNGLFIRHPVWWRKATP